MNSQHHNILISLLPLTAQLVHSWPATRDAKPKYPFNELVVFGDQLSDNGNGSTAHGLNPGNIYGFGTWTDGPVAAMYLADLLGVPLNDYAWGGWFGGGLAGPTVDNDYTPAKNTVNGQPVPSTYDQIYNNYTADGAPDNIKKSLQFIWIGQNDLKKHTNWYAEDPNDITVNAKTNVYFYGNWTSRLLEQADHLLDLGAPAVMLVNIFPLNTAPGTKYFWCHGDQTCATNWGLVIEAANDYLKKAIAASPNAKKLIYYDVYGYMTQIMEDKDDYGFTRPLDQYCDGNHSLPEMKWEICTKFRPASWKGARPFFWFNNGQMETHVHFYIAQNMKKCIDAFFAKTK